MDRYSLRHIMAALLVAEELRVPNITSTDPYLNENALRQQFTPMIENTYFIADLMFEIGDKAQKDLD